MADLRRDVRRALSFVPLLLGLPALAGCFHGDEPPAEAEIAVFPLPVFEGSRVVQFLIEPGTAYWRTDLSAKSQSAVTYEAEAPGGERIGSSAAPEFPYTHHLRVASPEPGMWNLTLSAGKVVEGTLRVLVPG